MYNIHPIIVHFPIALLTVYFLIQIIPVHKLLRTINWQPIADVLLVLGVIGTLAAMSSGEAAEHISTASRALIETHSAFAALTTGIGLVLVGDRILAWLAPSITKYVPVLNKVLKYILPIVRNRYVHILLCIVGFLALLMTGILGGVIVYGTTADPLAPVVMKMLGL